MIKINNWEELQKYEIMNHPKRKDIRIMYNNTDVCFYFYELEKAIKILNVLGCSFKYIKNEDLENLKPIARRIIEPNLYAKDRYKSMQRMKLYCIKETIKGLEKDKKYRVQLNGNDLHCIIDYEDYIVDWSTFFKDKNEWNSFVKEIAEIIIDYKKELDREKEECLESYERDYELYGEIILTGCEL